MFFKLHLRIKKNFQREVEATITAVRNVTPPPGLEQFSSFNHLGRYVSLYLLKEAFSVYEGYLFIIVDRGIILRFFTHSQTVLSAI